MDNITTFEESAEFLKNPPALAPRPDFGKIRALRKHLVLALKQLVCPQSTIQGWAGLNFVAINNGRTTNAMQSISGDDDST